MTMNNITYAKFQPQRCFGAELEFNRSTTRDNLVRIIKSKGEQAVKDSYQHNHNNPEWFCKNDSSCGCEVASRKLGSYSSINTTVNDLKLLEDIATALIQGGAKVDEKCGMHVHIGVEDYDSATIDKFLMYWIKFEKMFLDLLPYYRFGNRYCAPHTKSIRANLVPREMSSSALRVLFSGRNACNLQHLDQNKIEIRCGDASMDPRNVKNWVRLLLHFAEKVKIWGVPENLNWYDPISGLKALGLLDPDTLLSPALSELREWIMARSIAYAKFSDRDRVKTVLSKLHSKLYPTPYGVEEEEVLS